MGSLNPATRITGQTYMARPATRSRTSEEYLPDDGLIDDSNSHMNCAEALVVAWKDWNLSRSQEDFEILEIALSYAADVFDSGINLYRELAYQKLDDKDHFIHLFLRIMMDTDAYIPAV